MLVIISLKNDGSLVENSA